MASAGGFAGSGGASGYGDLSVAWRTMLVPGWRADIGGELSSVMGTGSQSSGSALGSARMLRPLVDGGLWLQASGNGSKREAGGLVGGAFEAWGGRGCARAQFAPS